MSRPGSLKLGYYPKCRKRPKNGKIELLSQVDFESGIQAWPWDKSFHNDFYEQLARENPNGEFDASWWETFLPRLRRWKATRSTPSEAITREVLAALPEMRATWIEACQPHLNKDVSEVTWTEVAAWPELVARFKPSRAGGYVRSPVFRSKFCHFLAPAIFPVADRAKLGLAGQSYRTYFENVQREWSETPEDLRNRMREQLVSFIGTEPASGYPFVNKIVELNLIGRRARG